MRTVVDLIKALEGFSPTTPVQVGLVGPDDGLVVLEIHTIEAREGAVILLVESHGSDEASKKPEERMVEADQTGEAIATPPPPAVPGGLEGEGEEPEATGPGAGRPGDGV
jgi:hypothetical protein